ncbi:MAG: cytochrome c [Gemmataceae bacterium]
MNARSWQMGGGAMLALALVLLPSSGKGAADAKLVAAINKLAEQVAKDPDAAKKQAAAVAKAHDFDVVMKLFELRTKDGVGIGAKAGDIKPDGIESLFTNYEKRVSSAQLESGADDLARAAYVTAAIALITHQHTPKKKVGKKDPKDWTKWTDEMYKASLDLAAAFKEKDTKKVKAAATALNLSCGNCHSAFRN